MAILRYQNKYFISDAVEIQRQRLRGPIDRHYHDFVEIVYIIRGKCTHIINGIEYTVSHGDLLIINYNQTHEILGTTSAEQFNILLKPEFISANLTMPENAFSLLNFSEFEEFNKIVDESNCVLSFGGESRSALETLILAMQKEVNQKPPGWELSLKSGLNLLLITIFRKMSLPIKYAETGGFSEQLLDYIRAHCHEKLTLIKLAEYANYNPAYFSRLFKQYTNMTVTEYLRRARMERACQLLIRADIKIDDICLEVGYSDKTRFFRDFRRSTGMTPLEYRKSKK